MQMQRYWVKKGVAGAIIGASNTSPPALPLIETSPLSPVNRFPLNFLSSSGSFLFLVASGSAFHLWSLGYACRRGLISRVKVYWFLTRLRGGVVSYERFCLPLRVRCDEVKLLPVGDPTDPSGGERGGYGQLLTAVPSASADNSKLMAVQHSFALLAQC